MATTARQNGKHPGGRPRTKTPAMYSKSQLEQIDRMAEAQCKDTTIAVALGVDVDSFVREFAERTRRKRAEGKTTVMQSQFQQAQTTPVGAIWWGKQHLGQTDRQDVTSAGRAVAPVVHLVVVAEEESAGDPDKDS